VRIKHSVRSTLVQCACLIVVANVLLGYDVFTDDSEIYVLKWTSSPIVMQNKLPQSGILSDGSTLSSSVNAAMQVWNAELGTVQFVGQNSQSTAYKNDNGISEIVSDTTYDGEAFAEGTLAITVYRTGPSTTEADIVFNAAVTWDSYRGPVRSGRQDIRRVAIHELGHVLGLNHPNEAGQDVSAIMNSRVSNIDTLQADDIAGGRFLYGAPGVFPVNDSFATATAITLITGTAQLTGSNVAAHREPGEPRHAGAIDGHSVWWKWTPATSGTLVLDTLGSNFDTVLAVYVGSQVSSLTTLGSNDDTESHDNNPTPQRKRTSTVTVAVTAGRTYYIAVDGWMDEGDAGGYTGAITLTASFETVIAPPGTNPLSSRLVNISSRGFCSTDARVMIGGFVVSGSGSKRVLVRAVGPSLAALGIAQSEVLLDPMIEVHKGAPVIASNDNWGSNTNAAEITSTSIQIGAAALQSNDATSSALLLTLEPGVYTFIASGKNGGSGIVLLEVYDADVTPNAASFVNISTRAYSTTGSGVTIGGFVISGGRPKQVLLRAVGPTLTTHGIGQADVLVDPTIDLHQGASGVIATNDNWSEGPNAAAVTTTGARVGALPFAAADTRSSALLITLQPGAYTFIASGKSASSGIVLVEVYDAD
jgi:hypothetical protein